jgi:putative ABC transport system substrate-binding protein
MYEYAPLVREGGLISYGPSFDDMFQRAAVYVDKILKGAKPSELAVEQPTRYYLVVNLKTSKELGLSIPQSLLLRADEVIQ